MKKIININLSGRVIPIEDSAYEKLQVYIESLRRYFANEEGRDEIINDIESRVAELMSEKVRKGTACITDADVEEIIVSMGRPEDFDADATEPAPAAGAQSSRQQQGPEQEYAAPPRQARKRLYRDANDKFIGGVCSGLANYLNTDPAIVRILFAIITFGGFGLGFVAYIFLWIFLPTSDLESFGGKRLYRNPDDRVIGGVAGGLAAYFNTRTSTVRLIFAAPLLLSILLNTLNGFNWEHDFNVVSNIVFGSLGSTFFIAYVILWIVLPEARSNYEKMEMRGEKVDVNRIRQNVREGMGNMKERMKTWSEEVKTSATSFGERAKEFANTRGQSFATEVNEVARRSGGGIGHAIGVLFKVFFLFIAGTIAFALFVAVMALIFGGVAWWPVNDFLWTSKWQQAYAWGTLIFFLLVPLVAFIIWLIRRIVGVRSRRSYLGWTFGFLWTLGWVSVVLLAASISRDFRSYDYVEQDVATKVLPKGRLVVLVSQPELEYSGNFAWVDNNAHGFDLEDDTAKLSMVRFHFVKSADSAYHIKLKTWAYGRDSREARLRASKVQYDLQLKDSVLDLGNGYTIDRESKFRGQIVEVDIYIPAGKKIRFDRSVNDKLSAMNFRVRRSIRRDHGIGISVDEDYSERLRSDVDYTMDINGSLNDGNGNPVEPADGSYRYRDEENDNPDQPVKEKPANKPTPKKDSATGRKESMDEEDMSLSGNGSSPVFSLVEALF